MGKMRQKLRRVGLTLITAAMISAPAFGSGSQVQNESPEFLSMTADLVLVRPLMLATTLVGATVFVVSSPFSALGGNLDQAAETLVKKPFDATFKRCLGCSADNNLGL